ncbi:MAG: hypothetical protein Q8M29_17870 [Bacteroidota bacterium]|nr:hypothetical protein [Bacteroidota bacterium]
MRKLIFGILALTSLSTISYGQIKLKIPKVGNDNKSSKNDAKSSSNSSATSTAASSDGAYKINDKVSIEENGKWYPGYIMEVKGDQYKIHYDGYDPKYDTWVTTARLKSLAGSTGSAAANTNVSSNGQFKPGDMVEFTYGGEQIIGEITSELSSAGRYSVKHGTNSSWLYPKELKATNQANANIERNKLAEQKKKEEEAAAKGIIYPSKYKVGDKVIVPDRSYNNYELATIAKIEKDGYRVENNPSTVFFESKLWLPWDGYKDFFAIADKLSQLNYNLFGELMAFYAGKKQSPQTVSVDKLKEFLKASDEIEKELKQKYPTVPEGGNCNECPDMYMKTLAKKKDLIAANYLVSPAFRAEEYFVGMAKMKIDDLKRGSNNMHVADNWLGAVNPDPELEKSYQQFYKEEIKGLEDYFIALGMNPPTVDKKALFAKVKALAPEYETELLKVDWLAKSSDPFATKDASLEPMVKAYIKEGTVSKIGFAAGDWEKYESTTYWVAGRAKYARVWLTDPKFKYKYVMQLKIAQEYMGSGKYGKTYIEPQATQWFFYSK